MFAQWKPVFFLDSYEEITRDFIKAHNIRTILSDLDGTLAPENERGDSNFKRWLEMLEGEDVSLVVVSNNGQSRVDNFTKEHRLIGYGRCRKPSIEKIERNLFHKGMNPETTLFLGDQLFTDIWCGNRLGVRTALVKPIPGREKWKTKIKRNPEKVLFRLWGMKR